MSPGHLGTADFGDTHFLSKNGLRRQGEATPPTQAGGTLFWVSHDCPL